MATNVTKYIYDHLHSGELMCNTVVAFAWHFPNILVLSTLTQVTNLSTEMLELHYHCCVRRCCTTFHKMLSESRPQHFLGIVLGNTTAGRGLPADACP